MKKLVVLLMVLLAASTVFAAPGASTGEAAKLTVLAVVPAVFQIKLSENQIRSPQDFAVADTDLTVDFADRAAIVRGKTAYVNLLRNTARGGTYTINVSAPSPMRSFSGTGASRIGYTLTSGTQVFEVSNTDYKEKSQTGFMSFAPTDDNLSVISQSFSIKVNENDWDAAVAADDYRTIISFAVVTP